MKSARLLVTYDLLREVLHLPVDARIEAARHDSDNDAAEFVVTHVDLKDVDAEGRDALPLVSPTFQSNPPVVFLGWGQ